MNNDELGNRLHRGIKMALDSGEAATLEEAERIFGGYRLCIEVGPNVAASPTLQASLLTAVNTGRRCFLGGVEVTGTLDRDLLLPWRGCRTLRDAVIDLGGTPDADSTATFAAPRILIGEPLRGRETDGFAVQVTFDGWKGGVVSAKSGHRLPERQEFTPAGVLAGALGVSEAFQSVRGGNPETGGREVGLSLWRPEDVAWLDATDIGPEVRDLPAKLWLIGLGHLGQAYLWTLGFLPYAQPGKVELVLQDFDVLVQANDSTSPLTTPSLIGRKKTRAMAEWCEQRGFKTAIHERHFAPNFRVADDEPKVALCGVDNPLARAALEEVGFKRVVEAGLGTGTQEYLAFQLHTFPASRTAREHWGQNSSKAEGRAERQVISQPAYQRLGEEGLDECGLTLLAGRSVGASFVGAAASALVISEVLRMAMGAHQYELVDGTLRSLKGCTAIYSGSIGEPFNPGLTRAAIR